jgi:transposase
MAKRKKQDSAEKAKVALEAIKEEIAINEIASKYELHPAQVRLWKKEFLENAELIFKNKKEETKHLRELETEKNDLEGLIGQQTIEINFLKKNLKRLNLD